MSGMGSGGMGGDYGGYYSSFRPFSIDSSGAQTEYVGQGFTDEYKEAKKKGNTFINYIYESDKDTKSKESFAKEDFGNVNWRYLRDQGWNLEQVQKYYPWLTDLQGDEDEMRFAYLEKQPNAFETDRSERGGVTLGGPNLKTTLASDYFTQASGWKSGVQGSGTGSTDAFAYYGTGNRVTGRGPSQANPLGSTENQLFGWLKR